MTARETVHDFVVIGAGAAGEAAAFEARRLGASVVVVERELVGGSCPFWACMPSKALLHAAGIHAVGGDYSWRRASNFRDWMISREKIATPDDRGHVTELEKVGAKVLRGTARIVGPGAVRVSSKGRRTQEVKARNLIVAVGTHSTVPDLPGLDKIKPWIEPRGDVHPEACPRASWSWAVAQPAWSWPRRSRATACRSRSSIPRTA